MFKTIRTAAAALGLAALASTAAAEGWTPPGPIKLMIAFAAGGGADTQARLIAEALEAEHSWQFIPEQVTGKGGVNLLNALKDEPADGTVIGMVVTETLGYNLAAAGVPFATSDFAGLTTTAGVQMGIVAPASKGWNSIEDAIAAGKAGEALRFGTMSPKLSDLAYLLGVAQGVEFNIVQVRGGRAVMNSLNAGDIDLGFIAGIQRAGVDSGDLVNLASALSEPLEQTPDAPKLSDLGVDFTADGYFSFIAPAGLPEEARTALTEAIAAVVLDESTAAGGLIKNAFGAPTIIKGAALDALFASDFEAAGRMIQAASE